MAKLGDRVIYTTAQNHLAKTVRGGETLEGSVHHPEMTQFAADVGRVRENQDGEVCDLHLIVPGGEGRWVMGVREGAGAGEFQTFADVNHPPVSM